MFLKPWESNGIKLPTSTGEFARFSEPSSVFLETLGIQSPSENGNGTWIPCWGCDYTPQSSSDKVIGSLGRVIYNDVLTPPGYGQHVIACIDHGFGLKNLPGQIIATSQDLGPPKCSFLEGKFPKLCREFYVGEITIWPDVWKTTSSPHDGWKWLEDDPESSEAQNGTGYLLSLLFFLQTGWTSHCLLLLSTGGCPH